jgi:hypothetical protein
MADLTELGKQGLKGWRVKAAEAVAGPVSARTPLDEDQVRAAVGALFFALAVSYVVSTAANAARELRR